MDVETCKICKVIESDGIPDEALKTMIGKYPEVLYVMYNIFWYCGAFLDTSKKQFLVLIPIDPLEALSYKSLYIAPVHPCGKLILSKLMPLIKKQCIFQNTMQL